MENPGAVMPVPMRRKATIRSRFSTLRYNKVVRKFNPIQKGYVISNGFPFLLNLPDHLMIPMPLTHWIIDHISYGCDGIFRHKSKSFSFYKDMVNAIFGFDYGSRRVVFTSSDPAVVAEVELLRARYTVDGRIPVSKVVSEMLADNTEDGFMRSFIMFFVTTILCPRTANFVDPRLLYSLRKLSHIRKLDYGSYCYEHLFTEIDKFKDKWFRPLKPGQSTAKELWIGGCLPVLTIVYMDHVNFDGQDEGFDYGRPRIFHVRHSDFDLLENLDVRSTARKKYGALEIKDISLTPYAQLYHNPEHVHALQDEPDSSDDEPYMPAFVDNPEIPEDAPHMPMFVHNQDIPVGAPHMHVFDHNQEIPDSAPSTPRIVEHPQLNYDVLPTFYEHDPKLDIQMDAAQQQNVDALIDEVILKHQAKWEESHKTDLKDLATELKSVVSKGFFLDPSVDNTNALAIVGNTSCNEVRTSDLLGYHVPVQALDCAAPDPTQLHGDDRMHSSTATARGTTLSEVQYCYETPHHRSHATNNLQSTVVTPTSSVFFGGSIAFSEPSKTLGNLQTSVPTPTSSQFFGEVGTAAPTEQCSVNLPSFVGTPNSADFFRVLGTVASIEPSPEQSIFAANNTGPSTIDKRNKKEMADKDISPDPADAYIKPSSDTVIHCAEQSISAANNTVEPMRGEGGRLSSDSASSPVVLEGAAANKTGPSTNDKKNRKKRAAKDISPDPVLMSKKWKVDPDIDAFYTKYLRNKYFKPNKDGVTPSFILLDGSHVSYEHFNASYKARGHVVDDAMCAHVKLFNIEANDPESAKCNVMKYSFSPFLSGKLIKDPRSFDKKSCAREILKITKEVNLETIDLMHFPIVENNHWTLACVNSLYGSVNFFDSASLTSEKREKQIIHNLTTNLRSVFSQLGIQCNKFEKLKKYNPPDYPHQPNGYDCGFYVMLFMEHWNGKIMKDFSNIMILKYRMVMAYKMFHSIHNKVDVIKLEATKKKKNM